MTLYDDIGVPPSATKAQIKKAAKAKMQACHPDRPGGDEAKFKRINAAKRLLTDDTARKHYDETGSTEENQPEALTDEQHASLILGRIFIMLLEKDEHNGDLLHATKVEIAKGMREGPQVITAHKKKILKLERTVTKNLKQTAGKVGHIQIALGKHLQVLKTQLAQMELSQRIGPLMLEILKDYRWEAEKPQMINPYPNFSQLYSEDLIKSMLGSKGT